MNTPYGYSPGGGGGAPPGPGYNPYAAPHVGYRAAPTGVISYRAHGGGLKWAYLSLLLGGIVMVAIGAAIGDEIGAGLAVIGILMTLFLRLIVALIWTYSAWAAIPADYRVTATGKRVSPGEAVGFLFIPLYNLYWMFVASGGLCDALDYLLRSAGSSRTAPKGLSLAACICQIIPYANVLVAPFLWFFFMLSFDGAAVALETASANGGAGAGPAPQGFGGGGGYAPPAGGFGAPQGGYGGPPPGYGPRY